MDRLKNLGGTGLGRRQVKKLGLWKDPVSEGTRRPHTSRAGCRVRGDWGRPQASPQADLQLCKQEVQANAEL